MKKYGIMIFALLCVFAAGCSAEKKENHKDHMQASGASQKNDELNWKVDSFAYTNQNKQPYGNEDLRGKVWLANFIFTNCETVCPPMTAHMSKLQDMAKKEHLPVQFVSFSVDPERDTPAALIKFAKMYHADFSNWTFLTGYKKENIEQLAKNSFKMAVSSDPSSNQFIHGASLFLVNKKGVIVKRYGGVQDTPFQQIIKDMKKQNSL
ncbi:MULTISPECIES: SCO family protein [Fictibacillus]|uniref:SCO family protein n=1 Tax=Fictibacillus terranigra TaxID=3058424 RepID=A0ABT8E8Q9_9BACL|nr:SCO family protein [Fictibacillus sp. CENA-BCM004]MDN4074303.1 SCO family protein [Fictibacillus sp. CENA-BCM004]